MPKPKRKPVKRSNQPDWARIARDITVKAIIRKQDEGEDKRVTYASGATRCAGVAGDGGAFPLRYDLLLDNVTALKRVARTFGEGSLKYPARNWMKGMPESGLINHALAHIVMHREGDTTEDHLAHAVWNLMTLMHMQEKMPQQLDVTGENPAA